MTSTNPNDLPKPPPPNTLGYRASTYEFGEDTNIQSLTVIQRIKIHKDKEDSRRDNRRKTRDTKENRRESVNCLS